MCVCVGVECVCAHQFCVSSAGQCLHTVCARMRSHCTEILCVYLCVQREPLPEAGHEVQDDSQAGGSIEEELHGGEDSGVQECGLG
jgi:hypothetical protein